VALDKPAREFQGELQSLLLQARFAASEARHERFLASGLFAAPAGQAPISVSFGPQDKIQEGVMTMTQREQRLNDHRSNLNNPNSPEFGMGFSEPGIPPQPAQTPPGTLRPDRINEGRGQAPPRGRKEDGEGAGTVVVGPDAGYGAQESPLSDRDPGGIGGDRKSKERGFESLGSPFVGSVASFLNKVAQSGALPTSVGAIDASAAVLSTLARRLSGGLVERVKQSLLPELATLLDSTTPRAEEAEALDRRAFIHRIAQGLRIPDEDAELVARNVLLAMRAQLPPQLVHDVESQLPDEIIALWHTRDARERIRERIGS
jgi:uncharacterized protein (DUF2267 family)